MKKTKGPSAKKAKLVKQAEEPEEESEDDDDEVTEEPIKRETDLGEKKTLKRKIEKSKKTYDPETKSKYICLISLLFLTNVLFQHSKN